MGFYLVCKTWCRLITNTFQNLLVQLSSRHQHSYFLYGDVPHRCHLFFVLSRIEFFLPRSFKDHRHRKRGTNSACLFFVLLISTTRLPWWSGFGERWFKVFFSSSFHHPYSLPVPSGPFPEAWPFPPQGICHNEILLTGQRRDMWEGEASWKVKTRALWISNPWYIIHSYYKPRTQRRAGEHSLQTFLWYLGVGNRCILQMKVKSLKCIY